MFCLLTFVNDLFFGTIVGLCVLCAGVIILRLGHGVTEGNTLFPVTTGISSPLLVKIGVILELERLGNVLLVVRCFLGGILVTKLLVLGSIQSIGNVRVLSDLSLLDLLCSA